MTVSGCCPFILRFSRSMHRPNPRKVRGGSPRTSCRGLPDRESIAYSLASGFGFYKKFEYNRSLPVYNIMTLRQGSFSKSLRYHFLSSTGIKPVASLSLPDLIFGINSEEALTKLNTQVLSGRGKDFMASFSHIETMHTFMPHDKLSLCNPFESGFSEMSPDESIYIHTLPGEGEESLLGFLKNEVSAVRSKIIRIGTYRIIQAHIPDVKAKLDTIVTHSLVRSVSPASCLVLKEDYVRHGDLPLECVQTRDTEKIYPRAAIVDSGIAPSSYLREWEMDTLSFCDEPERDPKHGTFVTGRLLNEGESFGGIVYLNAEILPAGGSIGLAEFQQRLESTLRTYHKIVKVYNISLGSDIQTDPDSFSAAAHVLDSLQERYDVLFIISGGNYERLRDPSEEYTPDNRITSPAESVHSITVGSVTHRDTNVQSRHSPSLFTRRGPSSAGFIKPEVCAYGGSHEKRMGRLYPVGVFSIGTRNELAEDSGTSHAVPMVTALAARIFHRYSHAFQNPDMTKAILLHYTRLHTRRPPDLYTGYGIITGDSENFEDTPSSAVYLHEGNVRHGGITEVTGIPVPESMCGKNAGSIEMTLVYKTRTDLNFPHYYCCTNLELSLGYYKRGAWKAILTSKDLLALQKNAEDKETNREMFKWNPVKLYETRLKGGALPEELVLRITPSKRDFCADNTEIRYSVVLSFTHERENLFEEIIMHYDEYDGVLEPASRMWKTC
ncbi:S8 family peptidase [Seleniivibrio sp.]|uniref:S8 family peptidase n=1 Tax=Seleniivibrio sp. TaxID=2898801 RepID=UPI0025FDBE56|nr:S8 family peptidase [Seleniivibrio sp.]MCD8552324.1 S8 family peptidase [Seleniivibrio sp.]